MCIDNIFVTSENIIKFHNPYVCMYTGQITKSDRVIEIKKIKSLRKLENNINHCSSKNSPTLQVVLF